MDALELLKQRIDIVALMKHYNFEGMNDDDSFVRSCCAIHGGDDPTAFVANVENGRWFCHTGGCGGGDAFTLVRIKEGIGWEQSVAWLAKFFDVEIGDVRLIKRKASEEAELKRWVQAIQARRIPSPNIFDVPETALDVTKFRNFQPETLKYFGLKWVDSFEAEKRDGGYYTLRNRLLFPIVQDGIIIGASLRRVRKSDIPKWSHQPIRMKTSEILYNYDVTNSNVESVVVVEGIPDVWAYYEIGIQAVATFGAHLTEKQKKMLLRTGKDVVLSYDGDDAGRTTTKKVIDEMRLTTNLTWVRFEEGEDPANLTQEELLKRYEQRYTIR